LEQNKIMTAVEWIVEQLDIISKHDIDGEERYIVIQMAKEMEKKQIIDSWTDGHMLGTNGWITEDYDRGFGYYCKTFNKNYDDEI
jgi:hypothetical protein